MRLETRLECVESSSRALGAYQDGVREFTGRRLRLAERLSGVAKKLAGSWEGLEVDVYQTKNWTIPWELIRSSLRLYRRYQKDRQEHIGRSPKEDRETHRRECWRLPDCGSEVISLVVMFDCNL
ncbi:hypothetical protein BHM03_00062538 [Ensete ventricosum]|nr:hypothetical protein BHM03_00062538 [Ensete ventricosum]